LSVSTKVQESNPKTGLLQSAVVAAYATYLLASALLSQPTICNPFGISNQSNNSRFAPDLSIFLGALFTMVAVCYSTIRAALTNLNTPSDQEALLDSNKDSTEGVAVVEEAEEVTYSYSIFHFTFAMGAMYIGALLTDWQSISPETLATASVQMETDFGETAMWIKIVSSWLVIALYCWSLIAPILLPDREWH